MAISVVQTQSGTSASITLASPTTAGNCLVVCISSISSTTGATVSGVTIGGSASNFSQLKTARGSNGVTRAADSIVWACPNCPGGQTAIAISGSSLGTIGLGVVVYEVSGLASSSVLDQSNSGSGASGTSWTSNATPTTTLASELIVGVAANTVGSGLTGPSSPWTNTAPSAAGIAGQQIASSTGTFTYSGTAGNGGWSALVVTLKGAAGNVSVSLTTAQVNVAAPAPGLRAAPLALPVAQVTVNAYPVIPGHVVALPVAQMTVQARPPSLAAGPVALSAALVSVQARAPVPKVSPALPVAQMTVQARPPAVSGGTGLARAQVTIAARPPAPSVNVSVALAAARVTITALAPKVSRQLLIAIASHAGTDDYGNAFPQGAYVGGGIVQVGSSSATAQVELAPGVTSEIKFPMPSQGLSNTPNISAGLSGTTPVLEVSGPAQGPGGADDWVQLMLWGNDEAGTEARMEFRYITTAGGVDIQGWYDGTGWTFPAHIAANGGLDAFTINVTATLTVNGTDVGATLSNILAALSGASTSSNGLNNGTISGTSGGASAGTAHTHGPGSYSVTDGHHTHTLPTVP